MPQAFYAEEWDRHWSVMGPHSRLKSYWPITKRYGADDQGGYVKAKATKHVMQQPRPSQVTKA
jgi:hypothetical protein